MPFRAKSAEELAADREDFKNLPDDEYLGVVEKFEFVPKEAQQPGPFGPPVDQYKVGIRALSFADGSPLEDTEGNPVEDFVISTFISHTKMGIGNFGPSKARKFFAALLRQPVNAAIEIDDPFPDSLLGRQLYVSTSNEKDKKGGVWTRAKDFRPIKIERNRRSAATAGASEGEQEQAQAPAAVGTAVDDDEIAF